MEKFAEKEFSSDKFVGIVLRMGAFRPFCSSKHTEYVRHQWIYEAER
jgi:peroxiredoxin